MKRYYLRSNEPSSSSSTMRTYLTYGECQKNQAEHIGGHAVDGCQAFMPSGEERTPAALTCAACHCHRSYHKLEVHTEDVRNDPPPPPPTQGAIA